MISFGGGGWAQRILQTDCVAMSSGRVQEWDVPPPVRSAEAKLLMKFLFLLAACYFCNTTGMHNQH